MRKRFFDRYGKFLTELFGTDRTDSTFAENNGRKKLFRSIQIVCGMKCYENRFEIYADLREGEERIFRKRD